MQELLELRDGVSLLGVALPDEDVHGRVVHGGLDDERVTGDGLATLLGKVAVDDRVVEVVERADQLRALDLTEVEVLQLGDGVDVDVRSSSARDWLAVSEMMPIVPPSGSSSRDLCLLENTPRGSRWIPSPASKL